MSTGYSVALGAVLGLLSGVALMFAVRPTPETPTPVTVLGPERVVTVTGPRVEVPTDVVRYVTRETQPTPQATECVVMRWRK